MKKSLLFGLVVSLTVAAATYAATCNRCNEHNENYDNGCGESSPCTIKTTSAAYYTLDLANSTWRGVSSGTGTIITTVNVGRCKTPTPQESGNVPAGSSSCVDYIGVQSTTNTSAITSCAEGPCL